MAIDYENDIAPLRQQYFPMLTGERAFDANMDFRQTVIAPLQDRVRNLQGHFLQMQRQELAFKSQKLAFRQQREKIRAKREWEESLPRLSDRLDEINNSGGTAAEQKEAFSRVALDNIALITKNPMAAGLFRYQEQNLTTKLLEQAKLDQKAQSYRNSVANTYLQSTFKTDAYDEGTYNAILAGEIPSDEVSTFLRDERRKEVIAVAEKEKALERAETGAKNQLNYIRKAEDHLDKVDLFDYGDGSGDGSGEYHADGSPVMGLESSDRRRILDNILKIKGDPLTDENRKALLGRYDTELELYHDAREIFSNAASAISTGTPLFAPSKATKIQSIADGFGQSTPQ